MNKPFYGLLALLPASLALAETPLRLDSQTVTADFRQTDSQQLPEAVSVINDAQLKARSAEHLEQVVSFAPNVNIATTSSRGRYVQIRGIGETSQFIDPVNPAVGLMIDGIDMTGLGAAATLFDVQQVEILRGPQGTRFGANALAGMINIQSHDPSKSLQGYVRGKLGNYQSAGLGGAVSGALNDNVQGRLAVHSFRSDGYMQNDYLNRDDTMRIQETLLRGKLHWQPDAQSEIKLTYLLADIDNGYDAFTVDNSRHSLADQPGKDQQRTHAVALNYARNINSAVRFEGVVSGVTSDSLYRYDDDWVNNVYGERYGSAVDEYQRSQKRATLDLRLVSGSTGRIFANSTDWVVGAYGMFRNETLDRDYTFNSALYNNQLDTDSWSVYTEFNTNLSLSTRLIYGLRIENWTNDFSANDGVTSNTNDVLWGGKITLEHLLTPDHLGYVSLARGYKPSGVNSYQSLPEQWRSFEPEYNYLSEIGLKSTWQSTWQTRMAVFYVYRNHQQVFMSFPDGYGYFKDYFDNASTGTNYGLELESLWDITPNLSWQLSYGFLHTHLKEYAYLGTETRGNREQAFAPKHSGSSAINYAFAANWSVRLETEAKDAFYFSDNHKEKSNGYVLWHARLSYQQPNFEIALSGRNLGNQDIATHGFGGFNNDIKNPDSQRYVQLGEPRLIMLEGQYSF